METRRQIHVEFARPVDPDVALVAIGAHGLNAETERERLGLMIDCGARDEEWVMNEVSHALEEWLVDQQLPFVPIRADKWTLVVRPPVD